MKLVITFHILRVLIFTKKPKKKRPYKQIIAQIDPETDRTIRVFNSRKEVMEFLNLGRSCDRPLLKAMSENKIYRGYF